MKFIVGTKLNMTQRFDDRGVVIPVTAIQIPVNTVVKVKTPESDGYHSVQIGYGEQKESRINAAQKGTWGEGLYKGVREFRMPVMAGHDGSIDATAGDVVEITSFAAGDAVIVTATSKAKGFQGVVKRHGFHGGPRSHGQKHSEREPGSIGGGPGRAGGRVTKGMRMGGRMGGDTVTVKGLRVVDVDTDARIIYISGAVPGRAGTLVAIKG